jgi:hypothetical protein
MLQLLVERLGVHSRGAVRGASIVFEIAKLECGEFDVEKVG